MLTEESKLSTIRCFFFENVGNFGPQKCRKSFLSKIEVLTPWFSETAKMVIEKFVFNPIRPGLFSRSPGPGGLRGPDAKNRG